MVSEHYLTYNRKTDVIDKSVVDFLTNKNMPFLSLAGIVPEGYKEIAKSGLYSALESGSLGDPVLLELSFGWFVHYWPTTKEFPPAMTVSPGSSIVSSYNDNVIEQDKDSQFGTHFNKSFHAAGEIILLAINLQWNGVQIIDGVNLMKWGAWAVSDFNKFPCYGFDPTREDKDKAERITEILESKFSKATTPDSVPKNAPGASSSGSSSSDQEDEK